MTEHKTAEKLLSRIKSGIRDDLPSAPGLVDRAYRVAFSAYGDRRIPDGRPLIIHCLETANILTTLNVDAETVIAAILMDALADIEAHEGRPRFNKTITGMVRDLSEMRVLHFIGEQRDQAGQLRDMMIALQKDLRLLMIKLSSRLDLMRNLRDVSSEEACDFAQQTLDVYSPLAHRLGLSHIKSEMEDICFAVLYPEEFEKLRSQASESSEKREKTVKRVSYLLKELFRERGLKLHITGRTKRLYSTYLKMLRQGKEFDELFDLAALRIITNSVEECYEVLALLHVLWTPVLDEFDDYIARPKPNGYQSIHTVVVAPEQQPVEVQIRTWQMHMIAEYGVAAHFTYKEKITGDRKGVDQDSVGWVRQIADESGKAVHTGQIDDIVLESEENNVFVLTPQGKVISLPAKSTPVDFAYRIHTQIGHKCRGAKINGRIASIDEKLRSGDVVEIITQKTGSPSRDWLRFVVSAQARNKIRGWFKKADREENIVQGRLMLQRDMNKAGLKRKDLLDALPWNEILKAYNVRSQEELHAAIGCGDVSIDSAVSRIRKSYKELLSKEEIEQPARPRTTIRSRKRQDVIVEGLPDMMITFPKCCYPVPGDDIIGYVTLGRGLTIHRRDCPNVKEYIESGDRIVEAQWDESSKEQYIAEIELLTIDRVGVLQEILSVISEAKINVAGVQSKTLKDSTAVTTLKLDIDSSEDLRRIIPKISGIEDVISARRK
ncbi:MAG TPA: bifunctional (p)ppGpp synthetase/guanosine-3',5'-bis(diphosphate) 3'-pyrophosphohydrolase [bacterium]|nr:bifunctional (p)ppGpp synthetase/guanosine-3',5'-bis(diphosphate) 3'-pyrophosphohydrolase [bacterium]